MKSYRKKRNLFYDFMFSCCMLLCLAIPVTTFITYNIPVMALPGLGLAIATTVYIYNSLCYVSLTDNSLIIRHKSNDKQKTVYSFSEIDAVIFEYSFLEGWKIGIRQGYIRKDYSILLQNPNTRKNLQLNSIFPFTQNFGQCFRHYNYSYHLFYDKIALPFYLCA